MPVPRLFCEALEKGLVAPSPEEAHHSQHALRLGVNDNVILFDGKGREGTGRIVSADRQGISVEVHEVTSYGFDAPVRLTIAVAMPKTHRQGHLIEKCTELGVDAVWALTTQRTVAKPGPGTVSKWQRRSIEAAKQSGRRWVPDIPPPESFASILSRCGEFDHAAIADIGKRTVQVCRWLEAVSPGEKIIGLIGPEGGWTDDERKAAADTGLASVQVSRTILRTETAAIALSAICNTLVTGTRR